MLLYGDWLGLDVRLVTLFLDDGVWYTSDVLPRRWSESVRDCRFSFSGRGGGPSTLSCCECWDTSLLVEKKNYFLIVSKYHYDISNPGLIYYIKLSCDSGKRIFEKNIHKTLKQCYLRITCGSFGSGGFGGGGNSPRSGGSLRRLHILSWEREAGKLGLSYTPISPVLSRISFSLGVNGRSGREARLLCIEVRTFTLLYSRFITILPYRNIIKLWKFTKSNIKIKFHLKPME